MPKVDKTTETWIFGRNDIECDYCAYCGGVARILGSVRSVSGPLRLVGVSVSTWSVPVNVSLKTPVWGLLLWTTLWRTGFDFVCHFERHEYRLPHCVWWFYACSAALSAPE